MSVVLITGGAGFIGSELARHCLEQGDSVIVVDNLVNGKYANIAAILGDNCRFVEADFRDDERMAPLLREVSTVYHLACLGVRHSIHAPVVNHEVNATGTLHLLVAARMAKVQRFVYVSSSEVYGTARTTPIRIEHPTFPKTVYGAAKLAGECYTRAFLDTYGLPTVVVRPFNAFGPRCHHEGDSGEVIPKFMLRCMANKPMIIFGDGSQTRDFTFVGDTARGIRLAGVSDHAVGQTINLGQGKEIRIDQLAQTVAAVVGGGEPQILYDVPRPGDVLRLLAETSHARELLGFEPSVPLEEGLHALKRWYEEQLLAPEILLEQERVHNWI
ncbi:MAG: SDR family NAD(P)-dependent oxidoreductase [Magnetococcus sp. DMHC-6]